MIKNKIIILRIEKLKKKILTETKTNLYFYKN